MPESQPYQHFGVVPVAEAAKLTGLAFMRKLLDASYPAPPVAETADFWPVEVEEGRIVFEARPSARFFNPMGAVHGGWIATVLDSAMGCAVHTTLAAGQAYTTIELKTVFTRPISPESGLLRCEGTVLHKGGRIASAEGKLYDAQGKLLAHGSETCLLMEARPPSA